MKLPTGPPATARAVESDGKRVTQTADMEEMMAAAAKQQVDQQVKQ